MENWAQQKQTGASWGIFFHIPTDACLPISDYNEELLGVNPGPVSVNGKYPIDFIRIGFHPIKRVLSRFTGMPVPPCLQQAAVFPISPRHCGSHIALMRRVGSQSQGLWQHPMAPRCCLELWLLPPALFVKQEQKTASSAIIRKFIHALGVNNILPRMQFYSNHQGLSRSWGS